MSPAEAIEVLSGLGSTPDEIADELERREILGVPGDPCRCAIARALHPSAAIWADPPLGVVEDQQFAIPGAVVEFIRLFDEGWYPDLEST